MNLSNFFYFNALKLFMIIGFLFCYNNHTFAKNSLNIAQEANELLIKASKTDDENLIHQVKDMLSIWLQKKKNNSDKKLVAAVLRYRADAFMSLDEKNRGINDFQESIQYDPIAPIQFLICQLKREQGDLSNLHTCYVKAVDLFSKQKTPVENSSFLLARILSGDKSAITEYRNIFSTLTGVKKDSYKLEAEIYLNDATYKEIIKE